MFKVFRFFYATIAGFAVALILAIATELFSSIVHPFPPDFTHTQEEMCRHVARYPRWILGVVLVIWPATVFISTWTAARLGGLAPGLLIGTLLIAAVAFNVLMLPYPLWFSAGNLAAIPLVVFFSLRAVLRPREVVRASGQST